MVLVDLRPKGVKGAEHALERAVACNKNAILFDPEKPA